MFYTFDSQEERRNFGGSAFVEMQFCKLPSGTEIGKTVCVDSIINWQNDSLYIKDENLFYEQYSHIFDCGVYNNLKKGTVDIYGINYYASDLIDSIKEKLYETKPMDYEILIEWLNKAEKYNGFYILGI